VNVEAVPLELRERKQWVCFKLEQRDRKQTKVPYQTNGHTRASTTDPTTWSTFDDAVIAATHGDGGDGVGYVFADDDPFVGIDLDACLADDGSLDPTAAAIVASLDSYTERSISGRGLHVLVKATLNGGRHRGRIDGRIGFEVYGTERYFIVTGDSLTGAPTTIEHRQEQLDRTLAHVLPPEPKQATLHADIPTSTLEDTELLDRAFAAKNGRDLERLHRGDTTGYPSRSEADLALVGGLAFWTGPDPVRLDRLFRGSGLMRQKWDSRRGETTYGQTTIQRALDGRTDFYRGPATSPRDLAPTSPPGDLAPRPHPLRGGEDDHLAPDLAPDLAPEPDSWDPINIVALGADPPAPPAIAALIYLGLNHVVTGESEALKTWLMAAAAADELAAGRSVVWIDGDDVGAGVLLERLRLFGADDEAIAQRFLYVLPDGPLELGSRGRLLARISEHDCRLAILDGFNPLLALHSLDPNSGVDVEMFYRLINPIRKAGPAVVLTDNVVKSSETRGAWAIGSERKKSKAEVQLGMKTLVPLVRGGIGRAKITVHKDRPGHLTRPSPGILVIDGTTIPYSWRIEEEQSRDDDGGFRPTELMERVSKYLELAHEAQSLKAIEENVTGNNQYVRRAAVMLCTDGYASETAGPRGARMIELERIYRADRGGSE
jgi:putative DNA primase/helicase